MAKSRTFLPLNVNNDGGVNDDDYAITYNAATDRIYEYGVDDFGGPFGMPFHFTKFDGEGNRLFQTVFNAASCPISGNNVLYRSGNHQLLTSHDGSRVLGITSFLDGTHNYTNPGISSFDPTTLVETAFLAFSATSTDMPMVEFVLNGVDYAAIHLVDQTIKIVRLSDFVNRGELATGLNHFNNGFFAFLAGDQPSNHEQYLYALYGTTVFADGTGGGIKVARYKYDSGTNTITSASDTAIYPMEDFDSHWHYGGNGFTTPFSFVFDRSDNKIIACVTRGNGTVDVGNPSNAVLIKFSPASRSVAWKFAIPRNQTEAMQSAQSQVNGQLVWLVGADDGGGFTFPFGAADGGPLLTINTADGSFTSWRNSIFASGSQRPFVYFQDQDLFLFYVATGAGGLVHNNGWGALHDIGVIFGGTTACLEPILDLFRPQVYNLCKKAVNSSIEIGPFRFAEQKEADETSKIATLILGITQAAIDDAIEYDDYMTDADETDNWMTMVDLFGADIFEDWGEESDNEDLFGLQLMSTDDGISPQFQGVEDLEVIEDKGSTKQYVPIGYSAIFHRLKLSATNVGESFYLKFVDIAGSLTGRHR